MGVMAINASTGRRTRSEPCVGACHIPSASLDDYWLALHGEPCAASNRVGDIRATFLAGGKRLGSIGSRAGVAGAHTSDFPSVCRVGGGMVAMAGANMACAYTCTDNLSIHCFALYFVYFLAIQRFRSHLTGKRLPRITGKQRARRRWVLSHLGTRTNDWRRAQTHK
jgi:hypothetical protein